ncbi:hypothetical protein F5888DRAFT_1924941 [Russula emetica]|nr:hypothetical protein F5888DRAFT_1924941 [Russula emetica]
MSCPAPASAAPVLNQPLAYYDADPAVASAFQRPASSAILASPLSHIPPLPNVELLSLLNDTSLSSLPDNATLSRLRARILPNEGNVCFANAVLQLLVYCPPFWNLFSDLSRLTAQTGQRGQGEGQRAGDIPIPLVDATIRLLGEFVEDEKEKEDGDGTDPFLPTYVYDAMKEKRRLKDMLDGRRQDAEEFFSAYLDALEEELLALVTSINPQQAASAALKAEELRVGSQSGEGQTEGKRDYISSSVESPISRIFSGKFRRTVLKAGQPDSVTVESWRSLKLDIQPDSIRTVQDALARISQPQVVQVGPSGPGKAGEQVTVLRSIEALPPVLVLHLKRFSYDEATGGVVETSKPVQLSPGLEIPPDIMAPTAGQSEVPARYTLYAVLYHHGGSASGGHNTVDVLHPNAHETWLHIDDEGVSTVRHEDVFGRNQNEWADDRCAYLLFYRRTTSTQT